MTDRIIVPGPVAAHEIRLSAGEALFVLGANGTGKSSLMHHLAINESNMHWASAHRQLWMSSAAPELTPAQYEQTIATHERWEKKPEYRWSQPNNYGTSGTQAILTALHSKQRMRDRAIARALDNQDRGKAEKIQRKNDDALVEMTRLFKTANMPLDFSLGAGEKFMVSREGNNYPINELSDGERSAFILFASILTQPEGTLFLIDEPERHIHRSIACPLLEAAFQRRTDCRFIVSTHEVALPLEFPESKVLLLRKCHFSESAPTSWEADLTSASSELNEDLKVDIWGSRRNILFVEGEGTQTTSLDAKLYRLLLPEVTILPKGPWQEVVESVKSLAASRDYTWVRAHGLVDGDQGSQPSVVGHQDVYALEFRAVESLYYHPVVQRHVAERRCKQQDLELDDCLSRATASTLAQYGQANDVEVVVRGGGVSDEEYAENIVTRCSIKKTNIPQSIAQSLSFSGRREYENAVRDRLVDDAELRERLINLDSGLRALRNSLN